MKAKLMVLYNKKGFGSSIHLSANLTDKEKKILEKTKYYQYQGREFINIENYYIYFKTYIGGMDEYGREYRNVVAILFSFELKKRDKEEVKRVLNKIKNKIDRNEYNSKEIYKLKINERIDNKNKSDKKGKKIFNLMINIILIIVIAYLYYEKTQNKIIQNQKRSKTLYEKIEEQESELKRYKLYQEFLREKTEEGKKYLEKAEEELYQNIKKELNREFVRNIEIKNHIVQYLNNKEFLKYRKEIEIIKKEIVKSEKNIKKNTIQNEVIKYNKNLDLGSLNKVEEKCKQYLKENPKDEKIEKIIEKIEKIKDGIEMEIEVSLFDKSSILNNKKIYFEIEVGKKRYILKKVLNKGKEIYLGSFYNKIKIGEDLEIKIYRYNYDKEKIIIYENKINLKDLNEEQIEKQKKLFKFKLQTYSKNKFKI